MTIATLALVILLGTSVWNRVTATREDLLANGLVTALESAKIGGLRDLLKSEIAPHRQLVEPRLRERLDDPKTAATAKINFRIAMLPAEDGDQQVEPLFEYYMKNAKPDEVAALREFLADKAHVKLDELWNVLNRRAAHSVDERFRAASGLAVYDKESKQWTPAILDDLSIQLVSVPRSVVGQWAENLRPIGHLLRDHLRIIYLDVGRSERERTTAADLLGRYAKDEPAEWVALLKHAANREQLTAFVENLKRNRQAAIDQLQQEMNELLVTTNKREGEYRDGLKAADDLAIRRDETQTRWLEVNANLEAAETEQESNNNSQAYVLELRGSLDEIAATLSQLDEQLTTVRQTLQGSNRTLEKLASQVANLAVALLHLDQTDEVWPLLASRPDPRRRSYLIARIGSMAVRPRLVVDELRRRGLPTEEESLSISRALVLALGGFVNDKLVAQQDELDELLLSWFRDSADPGIHSATRWLLQKRGFAAEIKELEKQWRGETQAGKRWYVDKAGNTMVVFPAGEKLYLMGSPISEVGRERGLSTINDNSFEKRHLRRIEWPFAISSTEVTVEQFLEFRKDHRYAADISPDPRSPINYPTWYDAAKFCNWLSAKEGIPEEHHCYIFETRDSIFSKDPIPVKRFPADFVSRQAYRLPTEAEWEYVCRAGTTTSWFFGESDTLLHSYAWYAGNSGEQSTHPVGGFRPNDWGMFDMYGNVAEWCHNLNVGFQLRNAKTARPDGMVVEPARLVVTDEYARTLRGGGYNSPAARTRSASRDSSKPEFSYYGFGFRVVRSGAGLNQAD